MLGCSMSARKGTAAVGRKAPLDDPAKWLLLIHQLPAKPAYFRVKIWRRLQALGAVPVKNSVYALPATDQTQEDLEWLLKEILQGGGEAMVCESRLIDGLSDQEVRAMFDHARDAEYEELAKEARALAAALSKAKRGEIESPLARLKARLAQVVAIDFFGANGREAVDGLIAGIETTLQEQKAQSDPAPSATDSRDPQRLEGRTWVTRQGVHVDRIASAWLIRRFIDPAARFKFVPPKGYAPRSGELRFDMFEAEFTHEGDRCTFEMLLERFHLSDRGLKAISEIVHDIDLKEAKFGRAEVEGVRALIAGICMATRDDDERLARGEAVFDHLHQYLRKKRGSGR
jgi:hypothetical protein